MATKYIGDLCVTTGTFKAKDGTEKKQWAKVGAAFENEKGAISLKLDLIPMPTDKGVWISLFKPSDKPASDSKAVKDAVNTFDGEVMPF